MLEVQNFILTSDYLLFVHVTKESDRNHSALRTRKQHEQNKMTDVLSR